MKDYLHGLIRKSERYFKTDMLYAVSNGFWMSIGQAASIGIVIVSSIVFAYFLPKEVYGNYKFVLSAISVLSALSLSGMGTAVIQGVARGKEGVVKKSVAVSLRWGLLPLAVSLGLAIYYWAVGNQTLAVSMLIAGMCSPLTNAYSLVGGLFAGRKDFRRSTLYNVWSQVAATAILVLVAVWIRSVVMLVAVNFVSNLVIDIGIYVYVMRVWKPNDEDDPSLIGYGKHISFMNFFGILANQLDKILVFHWMGAVELAIYSFAIAIPEQVKGSYKNLFNIALPKMAAADPKLLRKSVLDKFYRLTAVTILAVAAYWFLAPYIYAIFFPKYIDSVWYSQVYMLGLIAVPGISLFSSYFQVKKDTDTLYKLTFAGNAVTILFTAILIYRFGVTGAVVENGLSWLMMMLINLFFFLRDKSYML